VLGHRRRVFQRVAPAAAVLAATCLLAHPAVRAAAAAQSDLDAFMQQVLAHRDDNWKKLQQYILDEREGIELRGPTHTPLWGEHRDYTWYLRDGFFVRSPVKFNGVAIGDAERRKYEDDYFRRAQARDRRAARGAGPVGGDAVASAPDAPAVDSVDSLIQQTRQPEFISSAYFLRFKFDEGHYALVGPETLDGRNVLRIEYYPTMLFSDDRSNGRGRGRGRQPDEDAQLRVLMNKAALVTLWVDQPSQQIVKFTFDNITPNFLPSNWLGQITDAHASMTMGQPFPGVWLPHGLEMKITLTLALGDIDLRYTLDYTDYRAAETHSTLIPDPR
jgi:hypothetical protein